MTTDDQLSIDLLIKADLEAQYEIKNWEAHRERIQARLRPLVEDSYEGETGRAGWEQRQGSVDYKAAVLETGDEVWIAQVEANFRKPSSKSFYVRPALKQAPAKPVEVEA